MRLVENAFDIVHSENSKIFVATKGAFHLVINDRYSKYLTFKGKKDRVYMIADRKKLNFALLSEISHFKAYGYDADSTEQIGLVRRLKGGEIPLIWKFK